MSWPLDGHAARDLDALRVDPPIVLGKQRRDHRSDVVGQPGTAQCRHLRDVFVDFRIIPHHAAAEIGSDGTRSDGVDRDPPWA